MSSISDFGLFLRHERELRGIPLEEIANTTKIHMRFLTALESNDYSEFPGDVFIKGYIRSYAKSIGTNVETIISAYEESVGRQRTEKLQKAKTEQEKILMAKAALRRNILLCVILLLLALAGYFLNDIYKSVSKSALMKTGESSSAAQQDVFENTALQSGMPADMAAAIKPDEADLQPSQQSPDLEQNPAEAGGGKPAVAGGNLQAVKEPAPTSSAPALPPTASMARTETTKTELVPAKPVKHEKNKSQLNIDEAKDSVVSSKVENAGEEKDSLRLSIKTTADSWFNVTVDDSRKMDFILSAGTTKSLSGKKSFKVSIGNKSGAELALNGRNLTLPDSTDNVIRDFQITPKLIE